MAIRKGLFSKPKWAAKSPEPFETEQSPSIFQQNVYEDILQEQRKKQERKATKQREKEDLLRERESEGQRTKSDDDARAVKKRRISNTLIDLEQEEDEDDDFDKVGSGSESESRSTKSKKSRERNSPVDDLETDRPSSRNTRGKTRSQADASSKTSTNPSRKAILIDDDDDEDITICEPAPTIRPLPAQTKPKSKPKPPPPPESESDSEEDEYLKELKRKAREDAKAKNIHARSSNSGKDQTLHTLRSPTHGSPDPDSSTTTSPPVQILIQTILPNCPPLGIIRRPSQTLESVHKHFCDSHNLSDNLRPKVFFTWNNQRLFKSTTTRSIIEQLKRKHGTDKSKGKIVLEAVTDEIFEHRLKQREEAKRRAEEEAENNNDNDGYGDPNGTIPPSAQDPQQRSNTPGVDANPSTTTALPAAKSPGLVLKLTSATPDLPPMQLRVHAHTPIDRIVRGYKSRMNVDMAREVYLVFEGERLDGEQTVGDVGFEDGDCVDVRCR